MTETLFAGLKGEDAFMVSPYHDLRHPLIFYYGHPATLYINKLRVAGLLEDPINPYFEDIFETGVDEMSWDDLSKNKMNWPSVAEVTDYRRKAYNVISNLIQSMPEEEVQNIDMKSPYWALVMGFEHERIHLETSSVLINELPLKYVSFPKHFPRYHASVKAGGNRIKKPVKGVHYPANEMVAVPAQDVTVGKPENFPSFGWDNECKLLQNVDILPCSE